MDERTAVTGNAASPSYSFSPEYLKSSEGVLKLVQFLFGLITWSLAASVSGLLCNLGAHQFILFVTVTSWILTTAFLIIFVVGINQGVGSSLPWAVIEFVFQTFWALFYFIASCVQAAYICGFGNLLGASILAYITSLAYIIHANLSFRAWKGYFPWHEITSHQSNETNVREFA